MNPKISEQSRKIWEDVKANHARLDSCPGPHEWAPRVAGQLLMATRHTCTKCRGTVDGISRLWYERGIEHGGLEATALRARVDGLVTEGIARAQEIGRLRDELRLVREGSIT